MTQKAPAIKVKNMALKDTKGDKVFFAINAFFLGLLALIILYPLYFIVIASISDPDAVLGGQVVLAPVNITFEGFEKVFQRADIWRGYLNTIIYTVVTVILFARRLSAPLEQVAFGLGYVQQVKSAAKRVFTLLDLPEEQDPEGKAEPQVRGRVELRHVDFSYDPEKPLIRDLNMDIKPGQKVAIVGPTGAGKTTIVNLLMRFYDISAGQILIDGRDVSGLSRAENRGLFAMVLQDTWLFKGTVAENVAYGSPGATREEIEKACDCAYCDHFIRRLPQGYDTVISEDSTAVSSGQKQLLTIARALLANRPLLILDEATSNVDTRTELLIQKAMDRLMGGRTCFE